MQIKYVLSIKFHIKIKHIIHQFDVHYQNVIPKMKLHQ